MPTKTPQHMPPIPEHTCTVDPDYIKTVPMAVVEKGLQCEQGAESPEFGFTLFRERDWHLRVSTFWKELISPCLRGHSQSTMGLGASERNSIPILEGWKESCFPPPQKKRNWQPHIASPLLQPYDITMVVST